MFAVFDCSHCHRVGSVCHPHYNVDLRWMCEECYLAHCDARVTALASPGFGYTTTAKDPSDPSYACRIVLADRSLASRIVPFLWDVDFRRSIRRGYLDFVMRSRISDFRLLTHGGFYCSGDGVVYFCCSDVILSFLE